MTKAITPEQLDQKLKTESFTLIDVRETDEFQVEHIRNSVHFPLASFLQDPSKVKKDRSVVFICRSGRRSQLATEKFLSIFPDATAYNLTGGILAWRAAHLPLVENDLDKTDP